MNEEDVIFNNDPLYMKGLIGKEVQIKTIDKKIHSGVVYVIDPIFKTVVLHFNWKNDDEYDTILIMYHAMESLEILSEGAKESYLLEKPIPVSENVNRKTVTKKWLKGMMIDVKESGDYLKIDNHLIIMPPYGPENCVCNNTIVLEKIQKLLESIPKNFS